MRGNPNSAETQCASAVSIRSISVSVGVALGNPELGLIAMPCALWPWINDLGGELKRLCDTGLGCAVALVAT